MFSNFFRFKPLKQTFLNGLTSSGALYPFGHNGDGTYSGVSSPQETEKLTGNGNKYDNVKLLSTKATSSSGGEDSVDYARRFLPPLWVDIQEEIERHIEEIERKSKSYQIGYKVIIVAELKRM